jgi:hypothetical protein
VAAAEAIAADRSTIIQMSDERRIRLILPFQEVFSETPMGRRTSGYNAGPLRG